MGDENKRIVAQCQQQWLSSCSKKQQVTSGIQAERNQWQKATINWQLKINNSQQQKGNNRRNKHQQQAGAKAEEKIINCNTDPPSTILGNGTQH